MIAIELATCRNATPVLLQPAAFDLVLDLTTGRATREELPLQGLEFPMVDKRHTGHQTSHLFGMTVSDSMPTEAFGFNAVVSMNRASQTMQHYDYGTTVLAEEHVHIASPDQAESQAWLVGTSFEWTRDTTSLNVFDARELSAGPIAVASLPYALPLGLHGHFTLN